MIRIGVPAEHRVAADRLAAREIGAILRFRISINSKAAGVGEGRKAAAEHWPVGGPITPIHSQKVVIMRGGGCRQFVECGTCRRIVGCGTCLGALAHALINHTSWRMLSIRRVWHMPSDYNSWRMPSIRALAGAAYHLVAADAPAGALKIGRILQLASTDL